MNSYPQIHRLDSCFGNHHNLTEAIRGFYGLKTLYIKGIRTIITNSFKKQSRAIELLMESAVAFKPDEKNSNPLMGYFLG